MEKLSYVTVADRVPQYLRFSQYWGTFFIFVFIICCICNYFISSVPRYFILSNFRGTFLISTYNMRLNFYSFLWLCTPIFHNFKMSGYARPNFSLFYTTYSLCLLKTYPDISFFLFFGVHMPKPPFISHNKYIVQFTQNLSKTLFITSFHKNNRPAFETRLYFFLHQKEAAH